MRFLHNKEIHVSKKICFFLAYTLCFAIIAGAVFSVFMINKKSFIWVPDGLQQHFNALLYYRSWLLSIIQTAVTEHRIEVPLWDMHIGFRCVDNTSLLCDWRSAQFIIGFGTG